MQLIYLLQSRRSPNKGSSFLSQYIFHNKEDTVIEKKSVWVVIGNVGGTTWCLRVFESLESSAKFVNDKVDAPYQKIFDKVEADGYTMARWLNPVDYFGHPAAKGELIIEESVLKP